MSGKKRSAETCNCGNDLYQDAEKVILVTGFGPFGSIGKNISWEAVQLLKGLEIGGYKIVIEYLDVIFKFIDDNVENLWRKYKPSLVVHVGVGLSKHIYLEKQSYNKGYEGKKDFSGALHPTGVCLVDGNEYLATGLDLERVLDKLKDAPYSIKLSDNPGTYLCGYVFYKSLCIDPRKSLFIHVPNFNDPYSTEEIAEALILIITELVKQL